MEDLTANWTPNQWVGYSVKNKNPVGASYNLGSFIMSNTATTLTYSYYAAPDTKHHLKFAAGDAYEIHRCLQLLDHAGTGKGDMISGQPPINQVTHTACAPHWVAEPSFSWNNKHSPDNVVYGFVTKIPFIKAGRDYYNLGNGIVGVPQQVKDSLRANVNGVDYNGDYVYPHPLVSGQPEPTPTATATGTPSPSATATATLTPTPSATPSASPQRPLQQQQQQQLQLRQRPRQRGHRAIPRRHRLD